MKNKRISQITGLVNIKLIKDYMKQRKLSQKDFARITQLNVWNLQKVFDDCSNYNIKYLFKIAKAMNLQVKDLFVSQKNDCQDKNR